MAIKKKANNDKKAAEKEAKRYAMFAAKWGECRFDRLHFRGSWKGDESE